GAFDNPTAKVAGQASARLAAPYHPEGVAGRGFQQFNPATSVAVAGMAPQEGDAAPLMSAPTVGLGETQKSTNGATAPKAADAVWENQSQGVLSWKKTFQIEKAEYKGICEWSRDVTGGVTGFKVKIHLEFKPYLGIFDQDPGDLISHFRYMGLSDKDGRL